MMGAMEGVEGESVSSSSVGGRVSKMVLELVGKLPVTVEEASAHPDSRARAIISGAQWRAAAVSGGLALPPGPLGMATILPDLYAIWRLQAQMVSDIAGVYGKRAALTREAMIYCLFRHAAGQLLRDLTVRVGERVLMKTVSSRVMREVMERVGVKVTQRVVGKAVARWLPLVGAAGVAGYAYFDTGQVGRTAVELFRGVEVGEGG